MRGVGSSGLGAVVTEAEFLNRFQRQPNGVWACTKPIKIDGPNGPMIIGQGASFEPGASFMGLDLANELDQMAAKHRSSPKPAAREAG
jgi:hypothetical protein